MDKKELAKLDDAVRDANAAHWKVENERNEQQSGLIAEYRAKVATMSI